MSENVLLELDREIVDGATHNFLRRPQDTPEHVQTNSFSCGVGKDYALLRAILNHWNMNKFDWDHFGFLTDQFCIAIPKHEMAKGEGNLEAFFRDNYIPYTHLYGKNHFCVNPTGHSCRDETCYNCPLNPSQDPDVVCPYYTQRWEEYVVIMPFEHINLLPRRQHHAKSRYLIYDEIPFRNYMEQVFVPEALRWTVDIKELKPIEIAGSVYNFSKKVTLECSLIKEGDETKTRLKPIGSTQYKYYLWLLRHQTHHIYAQVSHRGLQLFSFSENLAPSSYYKVLVNCGTTPISVRKKMFGDDIKVVEGISEITNPRICIGSKWALASTKKYLKQFVAFAKTFEGKLFITTNKDKTDRTTGKVFPIESYIREQLPNADVVHYGEIGTNAFNREYDAAFIYGGFHYDPVTRYKYSQHLSLEEIETMEDSVVEQAMHRCRPLLHTGTPIFLMTNFGIRSKIPESMIHIHPRSVLMIHGTHNLKRLPSQKWGEDNGIDKRAITAYRNFLSVSRRFFNEVWSETDIVLDGIDKGLTNKQIADLIGKSTKTVARHRKKLKLMTTADVSSIRKRLKAAKGHSYQQALEEEHQ